MVVEVVVEVVAVVAAVLVFVLVPTVSFVGVLVLVLLPFPRTLCVRI